MVQDTTMTGFNHKTTAEEAAERFHDKIPGKIVVITGGTWGGIGTEAARVIAKNGSKQIILTGRKESVLKESIANIHKETPDANVKGVIMDLSSLDSVKKAADEINSIVDHIDVLINNAGIMGIPYEKSADGYEMQFATNHLGHFYFTSLLKDKVFKSNGPPRVVNLTSSACFVAPVLFDDINFDKGAETYSPVISYGQSKTANILFTNELYDRYNHKLIAYSVHPGIVGTNLGRYGDPVALFKSNNYWGKQAVSDETFAQMYMKSVAEGASTTVVAAFSDDDIPGGAYLGDCQDQTSTLLSYATDKSNGEKLWKVSEEFIGQKF